jgi:hypothetical protein
MLIVAALLSALMGATLGLLGGGGSILTVPILVYVLGVETKAAIATSLLVVAVTSAVGLVQHARAGNVRWREGLLFGAVGMVGAYGGGFAARWLPEWVLLGGFAALMVATAASMLRRGAAPEREAPASGGRAIAVLALEGLVVGAVTGLVGAGGGFLVVPALVLVSGLGMRAAVGTSLLVITMKSLAGLAGHLSHVSIDVKLAVLVSAFAAIGALTGAALSSKVAPERLRRLFAVFVVVMAAFVAWHQLPAAAIEAVFVERWPFWVGGLAIGGFVIAFLLGANKMLGVSAGFDDACAALVEPAARRSWRLPFLGGIVLGGAVATLLAGRGSAAVSWAMGRFDTLLTASLAVKVAVFLFGGVLIGFGTRMAGGCTSGHGIVGTAQLARSSWIATATFMATGFVVANLLLRVLGG